MRLEPSARLASRRRPFLGCSPIAILRPRIQRTFGGRAGRRRSSSVVSGCKAGVWTPVQGCLKEGFRRPPARRTPVDRWLDLSLQIRRLDGGRRGEPALARPEPLSGGAGSMSRLPRCRRVNARPTEAPDQPVVTCSESVSNCATRARRLACPSGRSQARPDRRSRSCPASSAASSHRWPPRPLARAGAVVGLDVRIRAYPGGDPDSGTRHRPGCWCIGTDWRRPCASATRSPCRSSATSAHGMRASRDWSTRRAVATPRGRSRTRVTDVQSLVRRLQLKVRDGGEDRVLLVVADTHHNHAVVRGSRPTFDAQFPVDARTALADLSAGRCPRGSALVFL